MRALVVAIVLLVFVGIPGLLWATSDNYALKQAKEQVPAEFDPLTYQEPRRGDEPYVIVQWLKAGEPSSAAMRGNAYSDVESQESKKIQ